MNRAFQHGARSRRVRNARRLRCGGLPPPARGLLRCASGSLAPRSSARGLLRCASQSLAPRPSDRLRLPSRLLECVECEIMPDGGRGVRVSAGVDGVFVVGVGRGEVDRAPLVECARYDEHETSTSVLRAAQPIRGAVKSKWPSAKSNLATKLGESDPKPFITGPKSGRRVSALNLTREWSIYK